MDQLKSLGNKQEELKSQIQEANERQNFQTVTELQNELEMIADHQMQLVNEKAELEKQQKRAEKYVWSFDASLLTLFHLNRAKDGEKVDTEDTGLEMSCAIHFYVVLLNIALYRFAIFIIFQRVDAFFAAGLSPGFISNRGTKQCNNSRGSF